MTRRDPWKENLKGMRRGPVEETDGLIERGSRRELETEMKRNEVRQRESRGWEGEDVYKCVCVLRVAGGK